MIRAYSASISGWLVVSGGWDTGGSGCPDTGSSGAAGFPSEGGVIGGVDEADAEEELPLALSGGLVCSGAAVGFCSAGAVGFCEVAAVALSGRLAEDGSSAASDDGAEEVSPVSEDDESPDDMLSSGQVFIADASEMVFAESDAEEAAASGSSSNRQPVKAASRVISKTNRNLRIAYPSQN